MATTVSQSITVNLAQSPYQVIVADGLLAKTGILATQAGLSGNCGILTDHNVAPLYLDKVRQSLQNNNCKVHHHIIEAGEASKSLSQAEEACRSFIRAGLDRHSFLIALGGGVVGDLAGFVAAIFYRGIPCLQLPTTIVAQVDSSVGGKTGVNTPEGKNLIGSFHQPSLVLADTTTLTSLPPRELREGFAEIIKHAAIRDPDMLNTLLNRNPNDPNNLSKIIANNVAIKARIVEQDEKETSGTRALLNFGHTIGHAIEALAGYGTMLHGEAISLGLRAALILSERLAGLDKNFSSLILNTLHHYQLPLTLQPSLQTPELMRMLSRDKKFAGGDPRFVLLQSPANAFVAEVSMDDIQYAIDSLRNPPQLDKNRSQNPE